jgi:hypothetical protein
VIDIALGRGQGRMAQQLLDDDSAGPGPEGLESCRVPQDVRADRLLDPGLSGQPFGDLPDTRRRHARALPRVEQVGLPT